MKSLARSIVFDLCAPQITGSKRCPWGDTFGVKDYKLYIKAL